LVPGSAILFGASYEKMLFSDVQKADLKVCARKLSEAGTAEFLSQHTQSNKICLNIIEKRSFWNDAPKRIAAPGTLYVSYTNISL